MISILTAFTSCGHNCQFKKVWSYDEDTHWHSCVDPECTEVADEEEHAWDEGRIVIKRRGETHADGVKTYTCTVCQKLREAENVDIYY